MAIYTKKGDRGKTSLFSGVRVWKYHPRIEAYGTLDELNTILGLVIASLPKKKNKGTDYLAELLFDVQKTLFYICSYLADLPDALVDADLASKTDMFEQKIDYMTAKMPQLSNFIFPGGSQSSAFLQNARAVARRAERQIVKFSQKEKIDERLIKYVNRLSDFLFTAARFANHIEGKKERIWSR